MTDHPAWENLPSGDVARAVRTPAGTWVARYRVKGLRLSRAEGGGDAPAVFTVAASDLPASAPGPLAAALGSLGIVSRLANPWLWDALTTAILRQVVRAAQARILYRRWCQAHGTAAEGTAGRLMLAPGPRTVLALADDAFAAAGAAFHRGVLKAAAAAYLDSEAQWAALDPPGLTAALETIPRVGPWTAQAAAADYTGDFSVYPHGDLAVRTWARGAAPDVTWPGSTRDFEAMWRAFASTPHQLHCLTLLTLTWGCHASTSHNRSAATTP
jgi:3-methyladenine DNA glycosylase/8-oxoguanine DNA glycosylase